MGTKRKPSAMHIVLVGVVMTVAASAEGQVIFSAWPLCDDPDGLQGWASRQWDDGNGVQGTALIQQVTGVDDPAQEGATICEALAFMAQLGDVPAEDRPTSGFVYVWFGDLSGYSIGETIPAPYLVIPVTLPTGSMPVVQGVTQFDGGTIYRLCAQITPILDIPAGVIANVALVAEISVSNPVAVLGFQSNLVGDPTVPHMVRINLANLTVVAIEFPDVPGCDNIVALELYGPASIPVASTWGVVAMTMLVLTAGTLVLGKRRSLRIAAA